MELIENTTANKQQQIATHESDAYLRAKRRLDNLKGFYRHLIIYVAINSFITWQKVAALTEQGKSVAQAFQDNETYIIWILWGIGLAIHGLNVFLINGIFGQKWEERKIKQYMNGEESHTWK